MEETSWTRSYGLAVQKILSHSVIMERILSQMESLEQIAKQTLENEGLNA